MKSKIELIEEYLKLNRNHQHFNVATVQLVSAAINLLMFSVAIQCISNVVWNRASIFSGQQCSTCWMAYSSAWN